jgi:phage tail-like protein
MAAYRVPALESGIVPVSDGAHSVASSRETAMAILRERPYGQFNFLVDLGNGGTDGPQAGFQEVGPIAAEVVVVEYRNGNSRENGVTKLTGLNKVSDITLKRGIIGSLDLYEWFDDIRNGDENALRNVTIALQSEDHTQTVQTWKLIRARIVKYVSGPLHARGTDVAIEELVLAYERLEIE